MTLQTTSSRASARRIFRTFALVALPLAFAAGYVNPLSPAVLAQAPATAGGGIDLAAIDQSVEACTDFYQFACGGWVKAHPIPSDQSSWGRFNEVDDRNQGLLRSILEEAAARPKAEADSKKLGDLWATCMDEAGADRKGADPLKPAFARIEAMATKAEVAAEVAHLHQQVANVLFGFGAEPDFKDASHNIASVEQSGLGLPDRDYYVKDDARSQDLRTKYVAHVARMFVLAGVPEAKANADAKVVMDLETELARASLDRLARRDPANLYHKMTRAELAALVPSFDWNTYFTAVGAPAFTSLNVGMPEFMKAVEQQLATRPIEAIRVYLKWHVLHAEARWLSNTIYAENFAFYGTTLTGQTAPRPRWKRCVAAADDQMGEALGRYYVELTFGAEGKARVREMVKGVVAALEADIRQLDWMTDATKQQAFLKLKGVTDKIGYPDSWRDYSSLTITRGDLVGNVERARAAGFARDIRKVGVAVDHGEWMMTPPTLNAYYNPLENNINFPAGILQPPLFDRAAEAPINYGAIGSVIGHELTHGFDDQGRKFDAAGNLRDWWTEADGKEFEKRASCIDQQYSGYTAVDDVKLNGKLTLGENTADNGGLRLAYVAMLQSLGGKTLPPSQGFSQDQRFFIAYAQAWCDERRPEMARMLVTLDPHSPGRQRVNGVVSNMPEFQKAFACKPGQAMVRPDMCRVW